MNVDANFRAAIVKAIAQQIPDVFLCQLFRNRNMTSDITKRFAVRSRQVTCTANVHAFRFAIADIFASIVAIELQNAVYRLMGCHRCYPVRRWCIYSDGNCDGQAMIDHGLLQ